MQERNVVLAHQFFVWNGQNPETCDSETAVLTSGGLDAIDASVLEPFEYAALGHIHGAQKVGQERFRYCGTGRCPTQTSSPPCRDTWRAAGRSTATA